MEHPRQHAHNQAQEADLTSLLAMAESRSWPQHVTNRARVLLTPVPEVWRTWLNRMLLTIGCALIVSGTIHFFAYNWEDMGKWLKFILVEGLLIGSILAAGFLDVATLPGKTLRVVAGMLVGVFLAVFGQIYQTGADAWQLFAGWSALICGWTVISRLPALWLMQVLLLQLTIFLYGIQVGFSDGEFLPMTATVLAGAAGIAALVGQEILWTLGRDWASKSWWRRAIFVETLLILSAPAHLLIWGPRESEVLVQGIGLLLLLALSGAGGWRFGWCRKDYPALAVDLLLLGLLVLSFVARIIPQSTDQIVHLLIMTVLAIGLFGGLAMGIKTIIRHREEVPDHG